MGIKNLHRFLKKHTSISYDEIPLEAFRGKRVAVDVNVYLYRFKSIYKSNWLSAFIKFVSVLLKYDMKCVFVYDTKSPVEKTERKRERKQRKKNAEMRIHEIQDAMEAFNSTGTVSPILDNIAQKRGSRVRKILLPESNPVVDYEAIERELVSLSNQVINVTKQNIETTQTFFRVAGIPYYASENEAETLCALMCCHGVVDAVLSDDTDVLVYGTPLFMTKLSIKRETCVGIRFAEIIDHLGWTADQFRDFCIMCGTDYNHNIPRIANENAYRIVDKYKSLEEAERERTDLDFSHLNYKRVRAIFKVPESLRKYNVDRVKTDWAHIKQFLLDHRIRAEEDLLLDLAGSDQ